MGLECPNCSSTTIQPLAVVHASGTQYFHASHTAVTSDGQLVQGSSHGSQATMLAQLCAPPTPPSPMPFIGAYGIGGIVVYLSMMVCPLLARECVFVGMAALLHNWEQAAVGLAIMGLGWLLMKGWHSQAKVYRAAKHQWQNTWFCHHCGQSHLRG